MAGNDFVSIIDETLKRSLKNIHTVIELVKLRSKTYYVMDFMDKTRKCRNMKNHCGIWLIPCISPFNSCSTRIGSLLYRLEDSFSLRNMHLNWAVLRMSPLKLRLRVSAGVALYRYINIYPCSKTWSQAYLYTCILRALALSAPSYIYQKLHIAPAPSNFSIIASF